MNVLSMTKAEYEQKARQFAKERERVKKDPWRLAYHIMPDSGWLNDPNGLCQFHDIYHIYYQYSPFDIEGKVKLWGHVTTKDFCTWKQEEPVLFPDCRYDLRGAYSGSAYIHNDQLYFYYTGNVKLTDRAYDYIYEGREHNTMLVTSKDGYLLSDKKCLMCNEDYPNYMSKHVRDPKLYEHNGKTYLVLGGRTKSDRGCVLIYQTNDLIHFSFDSLLTTPQTFGYMWECPDLFDLDGQTILIACPQGVPQEADRYQNVYQCGYFLVSGDIERSLELESFQTLDYGFDFYAPQTFVDQQNRRILIGWMGMPDIPYDNPTCERGWQHALTIPRELSYQDGMLYQTPIAELKALRGEKHSGSVARFNDYHILERVYECAITIDQEASFSIRVRNEVYMNYDVDTKRFSLHMGADGNGRTVRSAILPSLERITIYSDTSSLEVFINDGAYVFTTRVYEKQAHTPLSINGKDLQGSVVWYKMNPYQWKS